MSIRPSQVPDAAGDRPSPHADDRPHARDKAIDGWRAVAAGLVVLSHAVNYRLGGLDGFVLHKLQRVSGPLASLGVQLFFVISGYIITSLLIREQTQRGKISIAAFYARRVCRIMPPLVAYYAVVLLLVATGAIALSWSSLLSSATFTCNTGLVECDWWVAHTWSLAVEEQFYLAWPLLFGLVAPLMRPRLLALVLAACTIGVIVQRPVFNGNFTSFACIAAGALHATSPRARAYLLRAGHWLPWLVAAMLVALAPLTRLAPLLPPLLPLLVTYLIFVGNRLWWVRAVLQSRPLQIVGLGSYSLYLWQQLFLAMPARYAAAPFTIAWLPVAVIASVYLVEQPFIRVGRFLSRRLERVATDNRRARTITST